MYNVTISDIYILTEMFSGADVISFPLPKKISTYIEGQWNITVILKFETESDEARTSPPSWRPPFL